MSERPIIFSGPMVRAILAGRKSQTRRLVTVGTSATSVPLAELDLSRARVNRGLAGPDTYLSAPRPNDPCGEETEWRVWCRIATGDRLWAREAWASEVVIHEDEDEGSYHAEYAYYRATPRVGLRRWLTGAAPLGQERPHGITYLHESTPLERGPAARVKRWRPSIFMPRWASRLTLEVTGVRVERLQAITFDDIRREGIDCPEHDFDSGFCTSECDSLRRAWAEGWDGINGRRAPWASSPWVWVIAFRVVPQEPRP